MKSRDLKRPDVFDAVVEANVSESVYSRHSEALFSVSLGR